MLSDIYIKPCPICNTTEVNHEKELNNVDLLKCRICGFVYANLKDHVIKSENSTFDDKAIASYYEHQTIIDFLWFKSIVKKIEKETTKGKARFPK